MHVVIVRLERHTLAKISPSCSRYSVHESNCRMCINTLDRQFGVENSSMHVTRGTTQNGCDYTGMRNFTTVKVQN